MTKSYYRNGDFMPELANRTITKEAQLKADVFGTGGRRAVSIEVNGNFAGSVKEWGDDWYEEVPNTGPTPDSVRIGSTPEEALEWWIKHRLKI
jgi:hypothetical protein